ncbi:hypothetical protein BN946_scf184970.g152 [Trametes cinnabarina]|uniref:Uncharacterized protein n=1 Tax=Pycnoporus cinnabarinus TaxID=5643 RepID=A0A060SD95_PYCCI|nr:hypothetical protein BN946_scf184970.g152 [Trametes cinnabarina]
MDKLQKVVDDKGAEVARVKAVASKALDGVKTLDESLARLIRMTQDLEATVDSLQTHVDCLENELAEMGQNEHSDQRRAATGEVVACGQESGAQATRPESKKARDNALQDAIRKCLCSIMGIAQSSSELPAPIGDGMFWEFVGGEDCEAEGGRERWLRPDWDRSWGANKDGWLIDVITRIRTCGDSYVTSLSKEHLRSLSDEAYTAAIRSSFDTMVRKWQSKTSQKGKSAKEIHLVKNKINNRKRAASRSTLPLIHHTYLSPGPFQKADERGRVRHKVPAALDACYDYQFTWPYQSTEESEEETVVPVSRTRAIDPETDTEAAGRGGQDPPCARQEKVLVSHGPAWRTQPVCTIRHATIMIKHSPTIFKTVQMLQAVDVERAKLREAKLAVPGRGNQGNGGYKARRQGSPRSYRDTKLPDVRKVQNSRCIPRDMVEPDWLASEHGKKYDLRILIADAMVDVPNVGAGVQEQDDAAVGGDGGNREGENDDELEYLDPQLRN